MTQVRGFPNARVVSRQIEDVQGRVGGLETGRIVRGQPVIDSIVGLFNGAGSLTFTQLGLAASQIGLIPLQVSSKSQVEAIVCKVGATGGGNVGMAIYRVRWSPVRGRPYRFVRQSGSEAVFNFTTASQRLIFNFPRPLVLDPRGNVYYLAVQASAATATILGATFALGVVGFLQGGTNSSWSVFPASINIATGNYVTRMPAVQLLTSAVWSGSRGVGLTDFTDSVTPSTPSTADGGASDAVPLQVETAGAAGTSLNWTREGHVHPGMNLTTAQTAVGAKTFTDTLRANAQVLLGSEGTASAPALAFVEANNDTGFFHPTENRLACAVAGVEQWRTVSGGTFQFNGTASGTKSIAVSASPSDTVGRLLQVSGSDAGANTNAAANPFGITGGAVNAAVAGKGSPAITGARGGSGGDGQVTSGAGGDASGTLNPGPPGTVRIFPASPGTGGSGNADGGSVRIDAADATGTGTRGDIGIGTQSTAGLKTRAIDLGNTTDNPTVTKTGTGLSTWNGPETRNGAITNNSTLAQVGVLTASAAVVVTGEVSANGGVGRSTAGVLVVGADAESTAVEVGKAGASSTVRGSLTVDQASTLTGAAALSSTLAVAGVGTFTARTTHNGGALVADTRIIEFGSTIDGRAVGGTYYLASGLLGINDVVVIDSTADNTVKKSTDVLDRPRVCGVVVSAGGGNVLVARIGKTKCKVRVAALSTLLPGDRMMIGVAEAGVVAGEAVNGATGTGEIFAKATVKVDNSGGGTSLGTTTTVELGWA